MTVTGPDAEALGALVETGILTVLGSEPRVLGTAVAGEEETGIMTGDGVDEGIADVMKGVKEVEESEEGTPVED